MEDDNEKNDDLPGLFGLEEYKEPAVVVSDDTADDARLAREGYHTVLARAQLAASQLHALSHVAQHPRFYEVLGQLMKVELEAADRLRDSGGGSAQPKTVNNTLVLNSTEILDLVKKKLKNGEV